MACWVCKWKFSLPYFHLIPPCWQRNPSFLILPYSVLLPESHHAANAWQKNANSRANVKNWTHKCIKELIKKAKHKRFFRHFGLKQQKNLINHGIITIHWRVWHVAQADLKMVFKAMVSVLNNTSNHTRAICWVTSSKQSTDIRHH